MKQTRRVPFSIEKAKKGAKIITRNGCSVRILDYNLKSPDTPIVAAVMEDTYEHVFQYKINGKHGCKSLYEFDLFIEEEVYEETDYNPYKETVKSISDMIERYPEEIDLQDFYDNVNVKCREAIEYDKKWSKKQEEKPADNKPKFQKGDWVTDIDKPGVVHQITDVIKNVTNHTYGYNAVSFTYGFFGYSYFSEKVKSMRLWNINDAKDGDVLHSTGLHNDCIFIFNGLGNWKFDEPDGDRAVATGYCCLFVTTDKIEFGIQGPDCIEVNTTTPATQAQRDLLFQKIKEAGYRWDSDKKELKKIEKKTRRMTQQELSWWLRECPEEHRECKFLGGHTVYSSCGFNEKEANTPIENILIRKNGGEWEEPLIEE